MMNFRKLIVLIILFCLLKFTSFAQYGGIIFNRTLKWSQIRELAKRENKYVFVDCYATWCGPCKYMDANVYNSADVGLFFNKNFICVKLQVDSSKIDDEFTRSWYKDAHEIDSEFRVANFPAYLFFSPEGHIVHGDYGVKVIEDFLTLGRNAMSPDGQIYTLLDRYKRGDIDYSKLPSLCESIKKVLHDDSMAYVIAKDYLINYFFKTGMDHSLDRDKIIFLTSYTKSVEDIGFQLFLEDSAEIDKIMVPYSNWAENTVDRVIIQEYIAPKVWGVDEALSKNAPDWMRLKIPIERRFNKGIADRIILESKITYSTKRNDWKSLQKYEAYKIEHYGLDTAGMGYLFVNNTLFDVFFLHSTDNLMLDKAIRYQKVLYDAHPQTAEIIDTYANLLYKRGETQKAIEIEKLALKFRPNDNSINTALFNMTHHLPTYVDQGAVWLK